MFRKITAQATQQPRVTCKNAWHFRYAVNEHANSSGAKSLCRMPNKWHGN